MSRVSLAAISAALAMAGAGAAQAADWGVPQDPVFRPAYPVDMLPPDDSLDFEAGLRYFYGVGGQRTAINTLDYSSEDASHFLELHGRIDDHSTSTYLSANLGYAAIIDGTYQTPTSFGERSTSSGAIAYGGADFGYLPFESGGVSLGGFVGYQYLNESIDMGRTSFLTASGGGDSDPNLLEVHGLRLGLTARAELSDVFDVRVDAAVIPYAALSGTYGAFDPRSLNPLVTPGNAARINGHLYGGAIDAMAGFKVTENMVIRAGARGYYLTGPTETYFEVRDPGDPSSAQGYRTDGTMELFRWGPVIELTGTF